ncbi:hypothetical protein WMY93_024926 [Mugilogobius chulae]|uniref:3CxxC-type domain-containing protein n=1 Tax=Mugilogobius chulae TaxID=88201 RepID=A0AAW0N7S6_9GOBI
MENWTPIFQRIAGWEQYIRQTGARFRCSLCRRTWPSNKVIVLFHFYLDNNTHEGIVKVRPYRQNCKICTDAPMEEPSFEMHYIEILMENLVKNIRKKCYRDVFDEQPRDYAGVDVDSPHEPEHCEGCIHGVCNRDDQPRPAGRGGARGRGRGYRR